MTSLIDQHVAKLRLETALIAGEPRKVCCVPSPHHPMVIVSADIWTVAHVPSGRFLIRDGLTQREAFERAMGIYQDGRAAGLVMADPLPPQLARIRPEDLRTMTPAARATIEALRSLLADTEG